MSTLAVWSRVVQSRDVSPHNFDGLTMSGLAFSVAPQRARALVSDTVGEERASFALLTAVMTYFGRLEALAFN